MPSSLVVDPQKKVRSLRDVAEPTWPTPTVMDTWTFLVTEIAEAGDCLLRLGYGAADYSRNNHREVDIEKELGDVMLMLCTLATLVEVDLNEALNKTIRKIMANHVQT